MSEETNKKALLRTRSAFFSSALIEDEKYGSAIRFTPIVLILLALPLGLIVGTVPYGSLLMKPYLYTAGVCFMLFVPGKHSTTPPLDLNDFGIRKQVPFMLRIHALSLAILLIAQIAIMYLVETSNTGRVFVIFAVICVVAESIIIAHAVESRVSPSTLRG